MASLAENKRSKGLVTCGKGSVRKKLVDMSKHNYKTEPNVTITPDGKWVMRTAE